MSDKPCKIWPGSQRGKGYHEGRGYGQRYDPVAKKQRGAHVMEWEEANGRPVPEGMVVRHSCDNPPCYERTHLLLGTYADNVRDAMERGRHSPPPPAPARDPRTGRWASA